MDEGIMVTPVCESLAAALWTELQKMGSENGGEQNAGRNAAQTWAEPSVPLLSYAIQYGNERLSENAARFAADAGRKVLFGAVDAKAQRLPEGELKKRMTEYAQRLK